MKKPLFMRRFVAFLTSPLRCLGNPLGILSIEVCRAPINLSKYSFLRMVFSTSL